MLSLVTLYWRVTVNVKIIVLNCQICNESLNGQKSLGLLFGPSFSFLLLSLLVTLIKCLKGHKSLGLLFAGGLKMYSSLKLCLFIFKALSFCWSGRVSSSHWPHVSRVTILAECFMVAIFKNDSELMRDKITRTAAVLGELKKSPFVLASTYLLFDPRCPPKRCLHLPERVNN